MDDKETYKIYGEFIRHYSTLILTVRISTIGQALILFSICGILIANDLREYIILVAVGGICMTAVLYIIMNNYWLAVDALLDEAIEFERKREFHPFFENFKKTRTGFLKNRFWSFLYKNAVFVFLFASMALIFLIAGSHQDNARLPKPCASPSPPPSSQERERPGMPCPAGALKQSKPSERRTDSRDTHFRIAGDTHFPPEDQIGDSRDCRGASQGDPLSASRSEVQPTADRDRAYGKPRLR